MRRFKTSLNFFFWSTKWYRQILDIGVWEASFATRGRAYGDQEDTMLVLVLVSLCRGSVRA